MTSKLGLSIALHNAPWRTRFRRRLLTWFKKNARDLPWRTSRDPYRVWVSEIMLQQTQVETVKAYFERFISELPDVQSLAAADEQRVLRLWEGLGYYRRARQMHRAAQVVVAEFNCQFPRDAMTLQTLPGIGRYTAGAIASIAFDERVPILEANTVRLFARLLAYRDDATSTAGQKLLWAFAQSLVPQRAAGQFNQALMELGALVCTPKSPACSSCPAMSLCPTFAQKLQDEIPLPKKKVKFEEIHEAAVIIRRRGNVLLRRCADGERWAGLWDFPRIGATAKDREEIGCKIAAQIGASIELGELLTTIKHGVTRFRITLSCYAGQCGNRQLKPPLADHLRWVKVHQLGELPLSTTGRKLAALV